VRYADACRLLANSLAHTDPVQAEEQARKSIELLTELAPSHSDLPTSLGASLGHAYLQLAKALLVEKRVDGARAAAERALGYLRAVLKSSPETESHYYRQWLSEDHLVLSLIRLELRDVAGAANDAEELPRIMPDDPNSYLRAVGLMVRCADRSPDQRAHFHGRAMDLLGTAVNQRKLDRKLLDHPVLKALRDRDDFRLMMMDLAFPAKPFTR
jgi:hypothetical protein